MRYTCISIPKGSPIQHSDVMFKYEKIFEKSSAPTYKNWNIIVDQLKKIKDYNKKNNKTAFLHPALASVLDDDQKIDMDYLNEISHDKNKFKPCVAPGNSPHKRRWHFFFMPSSRYGNVKNGLDKIIFGKVLNDFKKVIAKEGTVEACNNCGWLKPLK